MAIRITINGKPAIANEVRNELERSVLDAIRKTIRSTTSFEESQQITLHVVGSYLRNMAFDLEGPEEIVNRARAGLS